MSAPRQQTSDPAHDVLGHMRQPLDAIFAPRSVAVIGVTEEPGSAGRAILLNLVSSPFGGVVFPVTSARRSVLGIRAYPNLAAVPDPVDLAIVVAPAPEVPEIMSACVAAGVRGAVVISAGFRERGPAGAALEAEVLARAQRGNLRLLGPNCIGVMRPTIGLNATSAGTMAPRGKVGFVSQSGALGTAILDWSLRENVGFSAFVSLGSMLDVGWGDIIDYLGNDPDTQSILIYMETIGDARAFMSAAREVALTKPIIVLKAGRTAQAARAAASHTGALTGSDEVYHAAFRRCGLIRVETVADLFYMAGVLAKQPRPAGPRLLILTNAGGPGVLATDALIAHGGELAELAPTTLADLDALLPQHWSHDNPIDILGDATPERYARALEIAARDPNVDGVLTIYAPTGSAEPARIAEQLRSFAAPRGKPLLTSWMGGMSIAPAEALLEGTAIPSFRYPDTAARIFSRMWRYSYNVRGLYETPILAASSADELHAQAQAGGMVVAARAAGRTLLSGVEAQQLLHAYGIPIVAGRIASSVDEAVVMAHEIGYPVALKLHSSTITHKAAVGGVRLYLRDSAEVRVAYAAIAAAARNQGGTDAFAGVLVQPMVTQVGVELIIGSVVDPQFGPILLFGAGGGLVEIADDHAIGFPPLNSTLARRMMEQTRIWRALQGARNQPPVDIAQLEQIMIRFSRLVIEQPLVREIEINPLIARGEQILALDARAILHDPTSDPTTFPTPAIRPYPVRYVEAWTAKDGTSVTIRPIRAEDEPLMVRFHGTLSENSVYTRYFHLIKLDERVAHERLTRICFIDYDREMALVVEGPDRQTGERAIMAVGRLSKLHGTNAAEFAVLVNDHYQRMGLGAELLRRLVQIGRDEGLSRIVADILPENRAMQAISRRLGFQLRHNYSEGVLRAELML